MKIVRFNYYMKNRKDSFDFLYLGENEGIGKLD
jgi:hypothetical protein